MTGPQLFDIWAPPDTVWSRWAKPILFAEMPPPEIPPATRVPEELPDIRFSAEGRTAIVVDLPATDSVTVGLRLARTGHRPVPLYNGAPGPGLAPDASALIEVAPLMRWLAAGGEFLARLPLEPGAPPAFLLSADRQAARVPLAPGRFDNRWLVFPQDFPSAAFLLRHGIERVLLLVAPGSSPPATDLAHVLLRYQEGGLQLLAGSPDEGDLQPLAVRRPSHFRTLWQMVLAMAGLRRNSAGGFGGIIPQPSSAGRTGGMA